MAGENKVLAGKAGAIDAVVAVMRAHVGHSGVSEQACWAMIYICDNGAFASGAACVCVCLFACSCLQSLSFGDADSDASWCLCVEWS